MHHHGIITSTSRCCKIKMASCSEMGMVAEVKHVLPKKAVITLAEKAPSKGAVEHVCSEVASRFQVKHYAEQGQLWHRVTEQKKSASPAWCKLPQACMYMYLENLRAYSSGREKFACLQIQWMDLVRSALHKQPSAESNAR